MNGEHSFKFVDIAVTAIIVLGVAAMAFFLFRNSRDSANTSVSKITKLTAELSESDFSMYEGTAVSGSEVINAINKFKADDIAIKVTTKSGNTSYYNKAMTSESGGSYKIGTGTVKTVQSAQSRGSANYINPTGSFAGSICKDSNNVIIGLFFEQQ